MVSIGDTTLEGSVIFLVTSFRISSTWLIKLLMPFGVFWAPLKSDYWSRCRHRFLSGKSRVSQHSPPSNKARGCFALLTRSVTDGLLTEFEKELSRFLEVDALKIQFHYKCILIRTKYSDYKLCTPAIFTNKLPVPDQVKHSKLSSPTALGNAPREKDVYSITRLILSRRRGSSSATRKSGC